MIEVHKRGRLLHWITTDATYFVTFNLFDAVPAEFAERLQLERKIRMTELERLKGRATPAETHAIEAILRERSEEMLDHGVGSCFMSDQRVAEVIANALKYFDGLRYRLSAWCVMPNHVHVVFHAIDRLDRIVHSWKSFSSKEANKILHREGKFWQDDYYDRLIRNQEHLKDTNQYVLDNPAKAGLTNWPFVSS